VFNRSYQVRAVKAAGGGHQVAGDAALHLPWAGIFEPWRPLILTALAAETLAVAKPVRGRSAANRCKKSNGRLQGVQLALFPDHVADPPQNAGKSPADSAFPPLAGLEVPFTDDDRPLADLFPEAYL